MIIVILRLKCLLNKATCLRLTKIFPLNECYFKRFFKVNVIGKYYLMCTYQNFIEPLFVIKCWISMMSIGYSHLFIILIAKLLKLMKWMLICNCGLSFLLLDDNYHYYYLQRRLKLALWLTVEMPRQMILTFISLTLEEKANIVDLLGLSDSVNKNLS